MADGSGPGAPTPPEVLSGLVDAFGADKVGETGYDIAAAKCTSDLEKAEANLRGSSLLYGELLPDGVSKALSPGRLGEAARYNSTVLELGMGSGKVAIQMFLQCQGIRQILGVELVRSRFQIAKEALHRLVASNPGRFALCATSGQEDEVGASEASTGRTINFRCADFFAMGLDLSQGSDIIFFAVNVPCRLFPELCQRLLKAKDGCRLFTYHALDSIWWIDEPCPFHQCEVNVPEADTFSTSWSPQGYRFYVYACDRSRPPRRDLLASRNEAYTQWQVLRDEKTGTPYYHNQETEISQWETPTQAGCWNALWSEEHQSYYFWHVPSGHAQWEAPKCLADLGWGAGGE